MRKLHKNILIDAWGRDIPIEQSIETKCGLFVISMENLEKLGDT